MSNDLVLQAAKYHTEVEKKIVQEMLMLFYVKNHVKIGACTITRDPMRGFGQTEVVITFILNDVEHLIRFAVDTNDITNKAIESSINYFAERVAAQIKHEVTKDLFPKLMDEIRR